MPYLEFKRRMAAEVMAALSGSSASSSIKEEEILADFSFPPNIAMGHVALPCFRMAKALKQPPQELAKSLAAKLTTGDVVAAPAGPYVNIKWKAANLAEATLTRALQQQQNYGHDVVGKSKRVVLEYCSPNIAKKLAFHHIRSTLIGNTLANIYRAMGYKTVRINFVGDWGAQFARLLSAFEQWGDPERLKSNDGVAAMTHLSEIYVRFHKDLDNHPDRLTSSSESLKRLETGDRKTLETWKQIRELSLRAMEATLSRINIQFDHTEGESHYIDSISTILPEVKEKAQAKLSEGAWIVEIDGIPTPALIQKRDGTTLYLTRDIAAAIDRFQRFQFEKMLYVVSEQQKLHFQLLFGLLGKMGYSWNTACEHVAFGTVLFGSEKMSTREGRVILLDDILNEAKALALVECTQKNPDLSNKEEVAEMIGIGAIIFGELSAHRQRDIEFDWKHILALDGETGPYVQYAAVRCQSLLEKANVTREELVKGIEIAKTYEFSVEEEALVLCLSRFRSVLHQITRENEPFYLTQYLIECAKAFSRFYYHHPVLQAGEAHQRQVRLTFVAATHQVLKNGLELLGIPCPKEM